MGMMSLPSMHRVFTLLLVGAAQVGCAPDAEHVVADGGISTTGPSGDSDTGATPGSSTSGSVDTTGGDADPDGTSGSSSSSGGEGSSDDGTSSGGAPASTPFIDACIEGVNLQRAMEGLSALSRWTDAEACAMQVATDDAAMGTMGEPFASQRGEAKLCEATHAQYCGAAAAAWDDPEQAIVDCAERYFSEGPQGSNYANMMDPANTEVACGWAQSSGGWFFAYHLFR